jgi:hypothetical protein
VAAEFSSYAGKYRGYAMVVEKMDRFSRMGIDTTSDYVRGFSPLEWGRFTSAS